jgi:hypothetical protein
LFEISQARAYIVEVVATVIAPLYRVSAEQSAGVPEVEYRIVLDPVADKVTDCVLLYNPATGLATGSGQPAVCIV